MTGQRTPRFPGLAGYRVLAEGLAELGLRHAADLFAAEAVPFGAEADAAGRARFMVLDGFRLAEAGGAWRRVDGSAIGLVRARFAERFKGGAEQADVLLAMLEGALAADSGILRHLLLYQLDAVVADLRPGDDARGHLLDLGVHSCEVDAVSAMVEAGTRPTPAARAAAEQVADVFAADRVHAAAELLRQIAPGPGDWRLERIEAEVGLRLDRAHALIGEADALVRENRFEQAGDRYLEAVRTAPDVPGLRDGLVRAAIRRAEQTESGSSGSDEQYGLLRSEAVDDGVELVYEQAREFADPRAAACTLLRFDAGAGHTETLIAGHACGAPYIDEQVRFGQEVRYVAFPERDGLICGAAVASGPIRYAPDVDNAVLRYTPRGVRLDWRRPKRATMVNVLRYPATAGHRESEPVSIAVGAEAEGVDDLDVVPGAYRYEIRCGYPASDGTVWSVGVSLTATVKPWPAPVDVLEVDPVAGQELAVRLSWRPPSAGTARVLQWSFAPREPGSDVSELVAHLPAPRRPPLPPPPQFDGAPAAPVSMVVAGQAGESVRFTAVSVLGDRAVAGASVLVQVIPAPAGLSVLRNGNGNGNGTGSGNGNGTASGTAVVRFAWPEPAVLVAIRWEQDGYERQLSIPRSGYRPEGVVIPVSASECLVTVEPLGRPDAEVFGSSAAALLPALPPPLWQRTQAGGRRARRSLRRYAAASAGAPLRLLRRLRRLAGGRHGPGRA